ncbi:MAG: hypothetical protein ACI9ZV_000838 [Candidatus Azotimanducaceae bacterium]|jgi:hypothetical protein
MFQRISNISLLLLSGWLLTGPLALLQLGAWGWMVASYSQESSFEQAIIETFGDQRPCDVCRVIDSVEATQSSNTAQRSENKDIKLMLGLGRAVQLIVPTQAYQPKATVVCKPENALLAVPTPPPRTA